MWDSPYINHFLQPDTIIPDAANPQNWNRYSYVQNRPVNFNDPTGHRACADEYGNNCSDRRGNPYINRNRGCGGPGRKLCPKKEEENEKEDDPLLLSTDITLGLDLDNSQGPIPDYYSETENSANVPYFPGGNMAPNVCVSGPGQALCLVSFFVALVPPAASSANPANEFFLSFNLSYQEGQGLTISGFGYTNRYQGRAVFDSLLVNDHLAYGDNVLMPNNGSYQSIDGVYKSSNGIQIEVKVFTVIQTPNGPGRWPHQLRYTLPAMQ